LESQNKNGDLTKNKPWRKSHHGVRSRREECQITTRKSSDKKQITSGAAEKEPASSTICALARKDIPYGGIAVEKRGSGREKKAARRDRG